MVRSMMAQANLPISYWENVLLTVAYILNRVPQNQLVPPHMSDGQVENLTYLICDHGALQLIFTTLLISLENWELGVKSVSLLDTQNTLKDVCSLVNKQVELRLN